MAVTLTWKKAFHILLIKVQLFSWETWLTGVP